MPLCSGKTRTGKAERNVLRPTSVRWVAGPDGGTGNPNRIARSIGLRARRRTRCKGRCAREGTQGHGKIFGQIMVERWPYPGVALTAVWDKIFVSNKVSTKFKLFCFLYDSFLPRTEKRQGGARTDEDTPKDAATREIEKRPLARSRRACTTRNWSFPSAQQTSPKGGYPLEEQIATRMFIGSIQRTEETRK